MHGEISSRQFSAAKWPLALSDISNYVQVWALSWSIRNSISFYNKNDNIVYLLAGCIILYKNIKEFWRRWAQQATGTCCAHLALVYQLFINQLIASSHYYTFATIFDRILDVLERQAVTCFRLCENIALGYEQIKSEFITKLFSV